MADPAKNADAAETAAPPSTRPSKRAGSGGRSGARSGARRRRPPGWLGVQVLWSAVTGMVAMAIAILIVLITVAPDIPVPDQMRRDIQTRIDAALGERAGLKFDDIVLVLNRGWRPRVRLENVVLLQPDGQELARLSDVEASFSVSHLIRGELRPKTVLLTGAFATLQRGKDGSVSLRLGDSPPASLQPDGQGGAQMAAQADAMPALMERVRTLLKMPVARSLRQVEINALTLRYEDLQEGRAWTVDSGRVLAERRHRDLELAGTFSVLSGRDYASTLEVNYSTHLDQAGAEFGFAITEIAAEDIAVQNAALNWLNVLRAPISGSLRGTVAADGSVGPLNASLHIGEGVLQPTDSTRPIPFSSARSYFTFDPSEGKLAFDAFSVESPWITGKGEGIAYLDGVANGNLSGLSGQVDLRDLEINPDGLYPEPRLVASAGATYRLSLDPFSLQIADLHARDGDSTVNGSGVLRAVAQGWDLSMDAQVDQLSPERLMELWPDNVALKPRKWAEDNFLKGGLRDLDFALRARAGRAPQVYLDFDFVDASVRFARWLPPLQGTAGTASLNGTRFVATASAGEVPGGAYGAVDASGTSFIIPDVSKKPDTPAITRIEAEGPVAAVIALLNRPPLEILKNTTLPVDLAEGRLHASGTLSLPMKKGAKLDDMTFHATGSIDNVDSRVLVPGHRITAKSLAVDLNNTRLVLSGPAEISGLGVEARWEQPLGDLAREGSHLTGTVEMSRRAVETFQLGLPKGSVSGKGEGRFDIALAAGKPPALTLTSDLTGVGLTIPGLGWAKPAAQSGELRVEARLASVPVVDRLTLQAAGLSATGTVTSREGGGLDRASFASVRIADWFRGPVDLVGRGSGAPIDVLIRGGSLDMQRATFGGGSGDTGVIGVSLDSLKVTETIELTGFRGRLRSGAGMTGAFSGLLGGRTPVTGEVLPQDGRSAFRVKAADAGGVLRDSGLLTQARGGDFTMTLVPVGKPGNYDGSARITNTRVINAPAVAALLDAASIVGLLDELAGGGIQFSEIEARFRLQPDRMTLLSGSATGPSMGLSMDGRYDVGADRLAMQGVISPIYLINGIGSIFTRKGEGLIGFSYKLRGPAANPQVQVNPLSALAPGMLRDVFRDPVPTSAVPAGPNPATPFPQSGVDDDTGGFDGAAPADGPASNR